MLGKKWSFIFSFLAVKFYFTSHFLWTGLAHLLQGMAPHVLRAMSEAGSQDLFLVSHSLRDKNVLGPFYQIQNLFFYPKTWEIRLNLQNLLFFVLLPEGASSKVIDNSSENVK